MKARSDSAPVSVDAVMDSLTIQGIAFRGPVCTRGKHTVSLTAGHILLQSELPDLLEQNELNRGGIQELAKVTRFQQVRARPESVLREREGIDQ